MKYPLTKVQKKYFDFIAKFIKENNICPSYEEIKQGCGVGSKSTVSFNINALERRGWIKRLSGTARAIIILK
jgi:repressor LexA|tara:strand:+ start:439 stop:654 length:216 start_codon:yes stop_codon:yes gene_type:complete